MSGSARRSDCGHMLTFDDRSSFLGFVSLHIDLWIAPPLSYSVGD